MGAVKEKIAGLEKQNRHLQRWNTKLREEKEALSREAETLRQEWADTNISLNAIMAAVAQQYGVQDPDGSYRMVLPIKLVAESVEKYRVSTVRDGDVYVTRAEEKKQE